MVACSGETKCDWDERYVIIGLPRPFHEYTRRLRRSHVCSRSESHDAKKKKKTKLTNIQKSHQQI